MDAPISGSVFHPGVPSNEIPEVKVGGFHGSKDLPQCGFVPGVDIFGNIMFRSNLITV